MASTELLKSLNKKSIFRQREIHQNGKLSLHKNDIKPVKMNLKTHSTHTLISVFLICCLFSLGSRTVLLFMASV